VAFAFLWWVVVVVVVVVVVWCSFPTPEARKMSMSSFHETRHCCQSPRKGGSLLDTYISWWWTGI